MVAVSLSTSLSWLIFSTICSQNDATLRALSAPKRSKAALKSIAAGLHHTKPEPYRTSKRFYNRSYEARVVNYTQTSTEPRNFHFLPNATNSSLPVCFTEDVSQHEQTLAIKSLMDDLRRCACATNRVITVASTGRVGSGAMMSVIDSAINFIADDSHRDGTYRNATVKHSHARYYTLEKENQVPDCKQTVVYAYDDPIEVQLSLRKDIIVRHNEEGVEITGGIGDTLAHAKHLGCRKSNFLVYHNTSSLKSELLKRDVFAIRDHFDGYMQSHPYPMLSMAFSAYHSPESMRVLATFVQTPFSAVIQGWQKADDAHNATEATYSQKKGVEKNPRGEARLAALTAAERNSLLETLGRASQRTASFPEVCIWPAISRKISDIPASPIC